jgi:hypothetical protein
MPGPNLLTRLPRLSISGSTEAIAADFLFLTLLVLGRSFGGNDATIPEDEQSQSKSF